MERKPYAFFYGGYMDEQLLREAGVQLEKCEVGYVEDFALAVGPLANLHDEAGARVYGLLARLSHSDLNILYAKNPSHLQGAQYLPEAILAHTLTGRNISALTYICADLVPSPPNSHYLKKLIEAAESLELPVDYINHIRGFGADTRMRD